MTIGFFLLGCVSTIYSICNKNLRSNYVHVITGFYTIMELSQAVEYEFVNQCGTLANRALSEFAYVLVLVQPLMFHTIGYLRSRKEEDRKVFRVSITMFVCWIMLHVYARIIYVPSPEDNWSYLLSNQTCIMQHNPTSHLYWQWASANLKDYGANFMTYLLIWFIPPLFVKSEKYSMTGTLASFLVGTALTSATGRWEEHASIWCFASIPVTAVVMSAFLASKRLFRRKKTN